MDTIIEYVASMLKYLAMAIPLFALIRFVWVRAANKRVNLFHEIGVVLFFSFLIGLFALTFDQDSSDEQTAVNMIPFKVFKDTINAINNTGFWEPLAVNFLGNIIMFLPIGLLLPLLWRKLTFIKTSLSGS